MIRALFYWFFPFLKKRILLFFTDCSDNNAKARVFAHLSEQLKKFNFDIAVYGEKNVGDIAFDLYSIVSFWKEKNIKGNIVVGNYAPRSENYPNGAPFLLTMINQNYVIGNPETFYILKKIGLLNMLPVVEINILNTLELYFPEEESLNLSQSQFRSLEVLPLLIYLIVNEKKIITKKYEFPIVAFSGSEIIFIDNFGNVKTSIKSHNFISLKGLNTNLKIGDFEGQSPSYYWKLSDVPKGRAGFVVSGSNDLVELVVNGGSAAEFYNIKVGDKIIFH
jgi:hypothetical protein